MRISDWSSDVCSSDLLALGIDQSGCSVRERTCRIGCCVVALSFDENRPARAEAAEGVVEATGHSDEFGGHGTVEVRPSKSRAALEAADRKSTRLNSSH